MPKYIKWNSRVLFYVHLCMATQVRKMLTVAVQIIKQTFKNIKESLNLLWDIRIMSAYWMVLHSEMHTHSSSFNQIFLSSFIRAASSVEWNGCTWLPNYTASHPSKLWSEIGNLSLNRWIQHTTILQTGWRKNAQPNLLKVNILHNTRKTFCKT